MLAMPFTLVGSFGADVWRECGGRSGRACRASRIRDRSPHPARARPASRRGDVRGTIWPPSGSDCFGCSCRRRLWPCSSSAGSGARGSAGRSRPPCRRSIPCFAIRSPAPPRPMPSIQPDPEPIVADQDQLGAHHDSAGKDPRRHRVSPGRSRGLVSDLDDAPLFGSAITRPNRRAPDELFRTLRPAAEFRGRWSASAACSIASSGCRPPANDYNIEGRLAGLARAERRAAVADRRTTSRLPPPCMPEGLSIDERVDVVGYFFKRWAYAAETPSAPHRWCWRSSRSGSRRPTPAGLRRDRHRRPRRWRRSSCSRSSACGWPAAGRRPPPRRRATWKTLADVELFSRAMPSAN